MTVRVRRDVFSLGDWSPELDWYGRAVDALRARPLDDPTGWRYMAAVHGRMRGQDPYATPNDVVPADSATYWDQCQHQTWFFLPWHRGYLAAFEATIAKAIVELGGPEDWALPYWNYSASDEARIMPRDFYEPDRPDGSPNPLWLPWGRPSNGDVEFFDSDVSLDCLTHGVFAGSNNGGDPGFGGPITGFMHFGQLVQLPSGWLEDAPHNAVHGALGGLMGHPDYAGLDPIFWLHHCNIDRLWEVWRGLFPIGGDPTDPAWLHNVVFDMHDGSGAPFQFTSDQMLDTRAVMHGYEYDDILPPPGPAPGPTVVEAATPRIGMPELAGANDERVSLETGVATTRLQVRTPSSRLTSVLEATQPLRAYLNLEQIKGDGMPGNYEAYVRKPGGEQYFAGLVTTFGIERASRTDAGHGGNGLTRVLDITSLIDVLDLRAGAPTDIEVTLRKVERPQAGEAPPYDTSGTSLTVGRVSVYFS